MKRKRKELIFKIYVRTIKRIVFEIEVEGIFNSPKESMFTSVGPEEKL